MWECSSVTVRPVLCRLQPRNVESNTARNPQYGCEFHGSRRRATAEGGRQMLRDSDLRISTAFQMSTAPKVTGVAKAPARFWTAPVLWRFGTASKKRQRTAALQNLKESRSLHSSARPRLRTGTLVPQQARFSSPSRKKILEMPVNIG